MTRNARMPAIFFGHGNPMNEHGTGCMLLHRNRTLMEPCSVIIRRDHRPTRT